MCIVLLPSPCKADPRHRKVNACSLLKVRWGRGMLLGEVITSWPENQEFPAEVEVCEVLEDIEIFASSSDG